MLGCEMFSLKGVVPSNEGNVFGNFDDFIKLGRIDGILVVNSEGGELITVDGIFDAKTLGTDLGNFDGR